MEAAWPWRVSRGEEASNGKAPEAPAVSEVRSRDWSKSSSSTECTSSRDWSKSSSTAPSSLDWSTPSSTHLLADSAEQEACSRCPALELPARQASPDASSDEFPDSNFRRTASEGSGEWPCAGRPHLGLAVVRHAERADEAWDSQWLLSEESKLHPFDPPITAKGGQQAEQVALELRGAGGFHRVVSSPYLRCVQTALIIAERLDLPVELDFELGEIYGPTIFGQEPVTRPWRSPEELMRTLGEKLGPDHPSLARICPDSLTGRAPQWPEAPCEARRRCASSFQRYVQQARETEWGCVLVSHAYMVQASLAVFPPTSSWTMASIGCCGTLVGRLRCPVVEESGEAAADLDVIDFRTLRVKVADPAGSPRRPVTKARSNWAARRPSEEQLVKELSTGPPCALPTLRRRSDLADLDLMGSPLARRRGLEIPMGKSASENPGGSSLARRRGFEVPMGRTFSE